MSAKTYVVSEVMTYRLDNGLNEPTGMNAGLHATVENGKLTSSSSIKHPKCGRKLPPLHHAIQVAIRRT